MVGRIVRFFPDKKFGFIHAGGTDYFFHVSAVKNRKLSQIRMNDMVNFSNVEAEKGPRAEDVIVDD